MHDTAGGAWIPAFTGMTGSGNRQSISKIGMMVSVGAHKSRETVPPLYSSLVLGSLPPLKKKEGALCVDVHGPAACYHNTLHKV